MIGFIEKPKIAEVQCGKRLHERVGSPMPLNADAIQHG